MSEELTKYEAGVEVQRHGGISSDVGQARELAEVQAAVLMARRFPRDEVRAVARITNACARPGLAESAVYQYSRGGTDVSGPSIRLAEAIGQHWGNLQYGVREIEQRNGESTCEAFAWDMETNVRVAKSFKVPHIRHTRRGDTLLTDPRDIYEMVANQGARRVRACILGVIPGDVVEDAVKACEETLRAKANTSAEGLKKILKTFAEYGVTKAQLEARIQRNFESISAGQVVQLRKIAVSLKDGMSQASDWFEAEQAKDAEVGAAKPAKRTVKDAVAGRPDPSAPAPSAPAPDAAAADAAAPLVSVDDLLGPFKDIK